MAPFLAEFEQLFKSSQGTHVPLIREALEHLAQSPGKHIRPTLTGLCALLCSGSYNSKTIAAATVLELLHTASLVHDDVIDKATVRRFTPTLNHLYGNNIAVLTGDYIVANALSIASEQLDIEVVQLLANVTKLLSEGELLQMDLTRRHTSTQAEYLQVIERKTASLFSAASFLGAHSVSASPGEQEQCREIGRLIGMAFQMQDDILDYQGTQSGKKRGIDLQEGKRTLPLIHALSTAEPQKCREVEDILLKDAVGPQDVAFIIQFVEQAGGVAYTHQVLEQYLSQACRLIERFPAGEAQDSLLELTRFIALRSF